MVCFDRAESEYDLDEELLTLFKHFKAENEREANQQLNNDDLIVDFVLLIQDKISKLVNDSEYEREK